MPKTTFLWIALYVGLGVLALWPKASPRLTPLALAEPWASVADTCMPNLSIVGVLAKPGRHQSEAIALRHWGSTPLDLQGLSLRMGKRRHLFERSQVVLAGELLFVPVRGLRDQGGKVWLQDACGITWSSFTWTSATQGQWQWSPLEQPLDLGAELANR